MFALFSVLGWQAEQFKTVTPVRTLTGFIVLWLLFILLLAGAEKLQVKNVHSPRFRAGAAFLIILACWLPAFLIFFPGSFAYDVPFQLEQVFTGSYSTHHPLLHTLLLGKCIQLGVALHDTNLGAAVYTAIQMFLLAGCFALCCTSIRRQSSEGAAWLATIFFAVYPMHMFMAVNATKDVLFAGCFALFVVLCREEIVLPLTGKRKGILLASGVLAMLLRNNAVYAMAVWGLFLLFSRGTRRLGGMALACVLLALTVSTCLSTALHAEPGDLREMLSVPIQQLARSRRVSGKELTEEERQAIDELFPDKGWKNYMPGIADPTKFAFDTERFLSDPGKYVGIWLSIGRRMPSVYVDAFVLLTYPFYWPYRQYKVPGYYLQMGILDDYYEFRTFEPITDGSVFPRLRESLTWRFGARGAMQIPVVGWLFNMGVVVWALFLSLYRAAAAGDKRTVRVGMLAVLLWGTFLLGPVMAGRYVYVFMCLLPTLAFKSRKTEELQ